MTRTPTENPALITVVNVSLAGSERNYDKRVNWLDREFRLIRVGTDGDVEHAERLVREWAPSASAIAVTGIREARTTGLYDGELEAIARVLQATDVIPVTNGHRMRDVLQEWTIRHTQTDLPGFFNNARVVVYGGMNHHRTASILGEYTQNLKFADPVLRLGFPALLDSIPAFDRLARVAGWPARLIPGPVMRPIVAPGRRLNDTIVKSAVRECDVVVASYEELEDLGLEELAGKTLVSTSISDERLADLRARGARMILDDNPQPFENVIINVAVLEAMMLALTEPRELTDDDLLDMIVSAGLEPRILGDGGSSRKSRFAFVIHPLSQEYFRDVEPLGTVSRFAPPLVMDSVEKMLAYAPPFRYSHVTGITSPTGAEAEGWLITLGGTPKQLMAHNPEFTYRRLLAAAEMAKKLGAQIMGLGAFTKVVGDAGVTVAKRAPLPITTGNSYSASGALWAAHDALSRLGIADVDDQGRMRLKAMVVGATGAIGSVCARLVAMASDELWLVSPESAKLLALKEDIERENPRAKIFVAASTDGHLQDTDVIVTATSGGGKRVLDIMQVKPGCVITDVARPLDLSPEDVAKRPDVLVVESGEIELPGEVHMRDIGLPRGVAYACLAETIVLALEGRFENFTVGRNIEWERVKEIYELGLKHGMRLATISGVNGVYTDDDIAEVRRLALAARAGAGA
jgi:predicted amino acid dehydrogenase